MTYVIVGNNLCTMTESIEVAKSLKQSTPYAVVGKFKTKEEAQAFMFEHRRNEYIRTLKSDIYGKKASPTLYLSYKNRGNYVIVTIDYSEYKRLFIPGLKKQSEYVSKLRIETAEGWSLNKELARIGRIIKAMPDSYNLEIEVPNISIPIALYQCKSMFPISKEIEEREGKVCYKYERKYNE